MDKLYRISYENTSFTAIEPAQSLDDARRKSTFDSSSELACILSFGSDQESYDKVEAILLAPIGDPYESPSWTLRKLINIACEVPVKARIGNIVSTLLNNCIYRSPSEILKKRCYQVFNNGVYRQPSEMINLLFNTFELLEHVWLPEADVALLNMTLHLDKFPSFDQGGGFSLVQKLFRAMAVMDFSSPSRPKTNFWLDLLRNPEYSQEGFLGLRHGSWQETCKHLPEIKNIDEIRFQMKVIGLIDTHPEADWPNCAKEFCTDSSIIELIEKMSVGRRFGQHEDSNTFDILLLKEMQRIKHPMIVKTIEELKCESPKEQL